MMPVQITIRETLHSAALESVIRKKAKKLSQFHDRIMRCKIVVEHAKKHQAHGKLYSVRIDIQVPGKEFVVSHKYNGDIYLAVRDAFKAMERQLEEHAHKCHGKVKTHENILHGRIARLKPNEGYGFIEGEDGYEYYFSVTNVSYPNFQRLCVGDNVQYFSVPLSNGRQANKVIREF